MKITLKNGSTIYVDTNPKNPLTGMKMMCTDCDFRTARWSAMKLHYAVSHVTVKHPSVYFTKEARKK